MKREKHLHKILALVLALAACGGNDGGNAGNNGGSQPSQSDNNTGNDNNDDAGNAGGESVTLTWAIWDRDSTPYWDALANGYMASHDGVSIEMIDLGSAD